MNIDIEQRLLDIGQPGSDYISKVCRDAAEEIKRVRQERDRWKRTAVTIATWEYFESAQKVAEDFYKDELEKELKQND